MLHFREFRTGQRRDDRDVTPPPVLRAEGSVNSSSPDPQEGLILRSRQAPPPPGAAGASLLPRFFESPPVATLSFRAIAPYSYENANNSAGS